MAENIRIDSHKLIYHPNRVAKWLSGEDIYPIEVEISPSGACNHRCIFCSLDYLGYVPKFLDKDVILKNLQIMHEHGLKSVICAGEGEPLLNKDFVDIVKGIKAIGLDVAMSTNGVLFTREKAEACLDKFTWIRFSVASLNKEAYNEIQRGREDDLDKLLENLEECVKIKMDRHLKTTLGVQCLLLPQNIETIPEMAQKLKEIGKGQIDYLTVKPYMHHFQTENKFEIDYSDIEKVRKGIEKYSDDDFSVFFRINAMQKLNRGKAYKKCLGLPFMSHIDAGGNVWPCCDLVGADGLSYGNIYEEDFDKIWSGNKRRDVIEKINSYNLNKICNPSCRLDSINRYLTELKNPEAHVNFI